MQNLYLATIYTAAIVCLLTSLLLFARRKEGERSRVILACIILFSVGNYLPRYVALCHHEIPNLVISPQTLLQAIFMVTSYIMYPIEVISPGYLNLRRIVKIYIPWLILFGIYMLCNWLGVVYTPYGSLLEMLPNFTRFEVWFRLLLAILIFAPVLTIFFIPYTRRYNNAGYEWITKYIILFTINSFAYILVLAVDSIYIKTIYYYVSVSCSIGIAYMELFVRLIRKPITNRESIEPSPDAKVAEQLSAETNFTTQVTIQNSPTCATAQSAKLRSRLQLYVEQTRAYRDPDLSINTLARALYTNRTTLGHAIRELGYESFTVYINTLRICDFIESVKKRHWDNYQDAFYNAGFRSRATAIRNFRQITGTTPSVYFQKGLFDEA